MGLVRRAALVLTCFVSGLPAHAAPELTAADLDTFLDGFVPHAIRSADIAGAVVSVVKDGELLFAKGYGYADLEQRKPVVASETIFRIASISKTFTWTAVMQLVEQGRLDLDRDVNTYLDFEIPPKFGKPITLRHLMTHTSGFETTNRGAFTGDLQQLLPLREYLERNVPARIFPPGTLNSYSNYGTGLAGYIVAHVSGKPFEDYVADNILHPLGMSRSTFVQPVPKTLSPLVSRAYASASDGESKPDEFIAPRPAGAMVSTATDMARFMIAHLQGGRAGDATILAPQTVAQMHERNFTPAPAADLNGYALGFYEQSRNGHRIVAHAGDFGHFHSDMALVLDANVGLFIAVNSDGRGGGGHAVRTGVFRAFLDRYFPDDGPVEPTAPTAKQDAGRVAGWYQSTRRSEGAMQFLNAVVATQVLALPDDTILVKGLPDYSGASKRWREIGPLVYREVDGRSRLVFVTDDAGHIKYWATDDLPPAGVYQPISSLGQPVMILLPLAAAVLFGTLLVWGAGHLLRRRYGRSLELSLWRRRLRLGARLGAAAQLTMIVGWIAFIAGSFMGGGFGAFGKVLIYFLGLIAVLGLIGTLACLANAAAVWMSGRRAVLTGVGESLSAFAALYVAWFILAGGLASFVTHY